MAPVAARDVPSGSAASGLAGKILTSRLLILAPHMDDEALACGGTMILHRGKQDIHCLFATDGAGSPAPLLPWSGHVDGGLPAQRRREALAVAGMIGVPAANLRFLDLPDGGLSSHRGDLEAGVGDAVRAVQPAFVLAPFRYDVHPDHTALNRAARAVLCRLAGAPVLLEYFVYHRLRLVPGRDVRRAVDDGALCAVDTAAVAAEKRAALDQYVSQTTIGYPWQDRPILTAASLERRCAEPEYFMPADPAGPLSEGLSAHAPRIRLACLAARYGKRPKDRARALLKWLLPG